MKRILLLVAAMCCISLVSCDNEQDLSDLSPVELEILELDNLIASQSGFDEQTLLADLLKGTMKMQHWYEYWNDGEITQNSMLGGPYPATLAIFFEDGTCWDCYSYWYSSSQPNPMHEPIHEQFTWEYDTATHSLIARNQYKQETIAKVLYYNTEDHRLIIEGYFMYFESMWKLEKVRISGYIDIDPAERERIIEEYSATNNI